MQDIVKINDIRIEPGYYLFDAKNGQGEYYKEIKFIEESKYTSYLCWSFREKFILN